MSDESKSTRILLTAAPDAETAERIAMDLLEKRLVSCVNAIPQVRSFYWWEGKIEVAGEVILLAKTTQPLAAKAESAILRSHPYDTPEIIFLNIEGGNSRYLEWIIDSVRGAIPS